ncbi:hypothetical protein OUZ56_018504 [Daphnia magna]|uniref:Uncharacterized protein n=1 Tax=Daphnia magna TaxID=35525 RepID=A0ABQ9Z909_9CRUS|nr:hypothetical protein OUZ56_018504 [Daphnia magna]
MNKILFVNIGETYTEARAKLAETKSYFDTQVSQDDEASAVNKEGRPKRKRRPTIKNFGRGDWSMPGHRIHTIYFGMKFG